MNKNLPKDVRQAVKEAVYNKADACGYLDQSRVENGRFMEDLVKDEKVGNLLVDFIPREDVKTYIKDAILNRYAKDKRSLVSDVKTIVFDTFGYDSDLIEKCGPISLHRMENGDLVSVTQGSLLKWETALRKLLEFIARSPGLPPSDGCKLHFLVVLITGGQHVNISDRAHITTSLNVVNVSCCFN